MLGHVSRTGVIPALCSGSWSKDTGAQMARACFFPSAEISKCALFGDHEVCDGNGGTRVSSVNDMSNDMTD